jgi:hypothetical protein
MAAPTPAPLTFRTVDGELVTFQYVDGNDYSYADPTVLRTGYQMASAAMVIRDAVIPLSGVPQVEVTRDGWLVKVEFEVTL